VSRAARSASSRAVRNPLGGYFANLIESSVLTGLNPAGDLRHFIGKGAHRKARRGTASYFTQDEAPALRHRLEPQATS